MTPAMLEDVVAFGYDRTSLDAIARPKTALAIWWRPLPDAMKAGLAALDLDTVDDVTLDLDADAPLDDALRNAGYPDDIATPLAADIGLLLRQIGRAHV